MLQELAENIWVAAAPQRFLGLQIGTRMTIVRYRSGKLFLHSPVPLTQELRQNLSALGEVGAIVAPNRYHHLHVKGYIERYPQAPVYAAPGLPVLRAFKILLTYGSRLDHITNTKKIEVLLELFSEVRRSSVQHNASSLSSLLPAQRFTTSPQCVSGSFEVQVMALPSDRLEEVLDRYQTFAVGCCGCRMSVKRTARCGWSQPCDTKNLQKATP